MENKSQGILSILTNADIELISEKMDWEKFLKPIKENRQKYVAESSQIGNRLDCKSRFAPKKLPKIAVGLYKKGDSTYIEIFEHEAKSLICQFNDHLENIMGKKVAFNDIDKYTEVEYSKIIDNILNSKNANIDIFYLQLRMAGVDLSEEKKHKISEIWQHEQDIEKINKKIEKQWNKKIEDLQKKFEMQKKATEKHIKQIKNEFQIQIENLEKQCKRLNEDKEKQYKEIQALNKNISNKEIEYNKKEKIIDELNEKIETIQQEKDTTQKCLDDKSTVFFDELRNKWEENNEKLEEKNLQLSIDVEDKEKILSSLNKQENELKKTIEKWNQQIENYFDSIDEKILNYRLETKLISKIEQEPSLKNKQNTQTVGKQLYVLPGNIKKKKEIEECNDYEDYLLIAEDNLKDICIGDSPEYIADYFAFTTRANLCPLLCGYGSQAIATALIAAVYGEIPTIISILLGCNNLNALIDEVEEAKTKTVIIADAFGRMNEAILLPLLRNQREKKIIFIAESTEELRYTPISVFRYVQLIVFEGVKTHQKSQLQYSIGSNVIHDYALNKDGYTKFMPMLKAIKMDIAYLNTRKEVFNFFISEGSDNLEVAFSGYISAELKWIITLEQKQELKKYLQSFPNTYSNKILESVE